MYLDVISIVLISNGVITGSSHGNSGNHVFGTTSTTSTITTTPAKTQKSNPTSTASSSPSTTNDDKDGATVIRLSSAIIIKQGQSAGAGNSETAFQYFQNGRRLNAQRVGIQNAFQTF